MSLAHSLPFLYQDKEMITLNIPKLSEQFSEITLNDYYHLHENPELSTQEKETTAYIVSRLREIGLEPKTDYPAYGVTALILAAAIFVAFHYKEYRDAFRALVDSVFQR